jgi:hypothetical protein
MTEFSVDDMYENLIVYYWISPFTILANGLNQTGFLQMTCMEQSSLILLFGLTAYRI